MAPSYMMTKRGAKKVIDEGNSVYELNKKSSSAISWRCERHYQGCKSTIRTSVESFEADAPVIIHRSEVICEHPNDCSEISARCAVAAMKLHVTNNRTIGSSREIVNLTLNHVDQHTKMQLPGLNVMSRNIRKWRNRVVNAPAIPQNRTGFMIPESISTFPDNSKFLMYDSGVNDPD